MKIEVISSGKCPFLIYAEVYSRDSLSWCIIRRDECVGTKHADCPLRKGPVSVELKEE